MNIWVLKAQCNICIYLLDIHRNTSIHHKEYVVDTGWHCCVQSKTPKSEELLEGIFNAALADRTQEGDRFIPPNPNNSYIVKLRNLVNEEREKDMSDMTTVDGADP